jgi:hypothetical protein
MFGTKVLPRTVGKAYSPRARQNRAVQRNKDLGEWREHCTP